MTQNTQAELSKGGKWKLLAQALDEMGGASDQASQSQVADWINAGNVKIQLRRTQLLGREEKRECISGEDAINAFVSSTVYWEESRAFIGARYADASMRLLSAYIDDGYIVDIDALELEALKPAAAPTDKPNAGAPERFDWPVIIEIGVQILIEHDLYGPDNPDLPSQNKFVALIQERYVAKYPKDTEPSRASVQQRLHEMVGQYKARLAGQ